VSSDVVDDKPEDVVLDEETVPARLQHEILHEGLGDVLIRLKLAHHIHQNAAVEHGVAVDRGHVVPDGLEPEAIYLLHDFSGALHLLALEGQETLLSIVQLGQFTPCGVVVEHLVVALHESRADGVEIGVIERYTAPMKIQEQERCTNHDPQNHDPQNHDPQDHNPRTATALLSSNLVGVSTTLAQASSSRQNLDIKDETSRILLKFE